jgi:hypothetical protein
MVISSLKIFSLKKKKTERFVLPAAGPAPMENSANIFSKKKKKSYIFGRKKIILMTSIC